MLNYITQIMSTCTVATTIGGIVGFFCFVMLLESKDMGNIIFRKGEFVPKNILEYMKSPFYQSFLWYPRLWKSNWLIMIGGGMFATKILCYLHTYMSQIII